MERIAVVGQGYVGLPLAVRAVQAGFDVIGVEADEERAKRLADGDSYVEDISQECLRAVLKTGRYTAGTEWADAEGYDICIITVPTPLRDGAPDLSYVEEAARGAGRTLRPGATVVLESTTYPGTTELVVRPILEQVSGLTAGKDFHLGYSPERIDPGNPEWHLENTPKVVSGIDTPSRERIRDFYGKLVARTVEVSSTQTAELTKLLENTFRHVNIALVNELATVSQELGVDIWEAVDAASTKPFGFMRFAPGPGVGGHCLPIDPSYLSWQVKRTSRQDLRLVSVANDVNEHMPDHVVRRITSGLNSRRAAVNDSRILMLGLAYKKNTGDVRESPAVAIAKGLMQLGAHVCAAEPHTDPKLLPSGVTHVELCEAELAAADAVVIATDHDAFDYDMVVRSGTYVFDTRNRLHDAHADRL